MNYLDERDRYYQRLDQLRAAHPEIYALRDSDNFVRRWSDMWLRSEMSMEEGLAKLALLLCEHRKELTDQLIKQVSITSRPYMLGVDLAKEGSERTAVYPSGDLQARKHWDDMPIVENPFLDAVTCGTGILRTNSGGTGLQRISPTGFWKKPPEDDRSEDRTSEMRKTMSEMLMPAEAPEPQHFTPPPGQYTAYTAGYAHTTKVSGPTGDEKADDDAAPESPEEPEEPKPQKLRDMFKLRF